MKRKEERRDERVNIALTATIKEGIDVLAKVNDVSVNQLINTVLEGYVADNQDVIDAHKANMANLKKMLATKQVGKKNTLIDESAEK